MANNLSSVAEPLVLNHVTGQSAWTPTTPLKLRLYTANGTNSAEGTQVTGGSYVSQTITFAAATGSGPATATNAATIDFTGMPACTVTGVEIWDSNATPKRIWYGPLSANKTVNAGDTFEIAAGQLSVALD